MTNWSIVFLLNAALLAIASTESVVLEFPSAASWNLPQFTSLVAFGDSYTDESRLSYMISTGGRVPPAGWTGPDSNSTLTGGRIWPRYVSDYTGANVYNYAVGGAVCSNRQVNRYLQQIDGSFPDVEGYQVPAFLADKQYTMNGTSFLNIPDEETVYSIWIGTNDLGSNAFLTESQAPELTLVDYINCVYMQFDRLYANGARYFVLMNLAPLQLTPAYATPEKGGVGEYPNATETSYRMKQQVNLVNAVYKYQTPFEQLIAKRYPGARFALYDIYNLLTDIYNNPAEYLNGTAPLNVSGFITDHLSTSLSISDRDSYMWYDILHPSEQTTRVIAASFVEVVKGTSKWATYW